MKEDTNILYLEDDALDEELIRTMILNEYSKCNIISVSTKKDFTYNLKNSAFDLILADYDLPDFDGFSALKITRKKDPDVPFIFVTGRISEDMAIEAIKAGATDYVFKDKLGKLIPALQRAFKEVNESESIKEIEKKLIVSNKLFRFIIEESTDGITLVNQKGVIISWNNSMKEITGIKQKDAVGRFVWDIQYSFATKEIKNEIFYNRIKSQIKSTLINENSKWLNKIVEFEIEDISGKNKYIESVSFLIKTGDEKFIVSMMRNISEKKKAEEMLTIKDYAIESSTNGIVLADLKLNITYVNKATLNILKYSSKEEIIGKPALLFLILKKDAEKKINILFEKESWEGDIFVRQADGKNIDLHLLASFVKDKNNKPICIIASFYDITFRKEFERELIKKENKYKSLFELSNDAIFIHDLKGNIIDVNEKACSLLGYNKEKLLQIKISELHPDSELKKSKEAIQQIVSKGSVRFFSKFKKSDGSLIDVDISSSIVNKKENIIQGIAREKHIVIKNFQEIK